MLYLEIECITAEVAGTITNTITYVTKLMHWFHLIVLYAVEYTIWNACTTA